jgi:hypothetical protein
MLEIKWADKIRNEEVHRRIDEEWMLWNDVEKGRTRWIGHTGFMKNITEGKIEGKVLRGKPRDKYMGKIK